MNIQFIFGIIASLLFVTSIIWYVYDVAKGRVRVAITSVIMLALINFSQLGALIAKELWYVVPFTLVAGVMNILIVAFGIKNGKFQFKLLDAIVLIGALAGLVVWHLTKDAAYNIYILTAVMLISVIPMIMKTFKDPTSETKLPWLVNLAATVVLAMTITSLQPIDWLVQARQVVLSVLMNLAIHQKASRADSKA
jgi:hypothetical protein